jgi:hypothetical protein
MKNKTLLIKYSESYLGILTDKIRSIDNLEFEAVPLTARFVSGIAPVNGIFMQMNETIFLLNPEFLFLVGANS